MNTKLPINIHDLILQRTIESERIEYKTDWNPESVMHTICAFANDFHNLGSGYIVIGVAEDNGRPVLPPVGLSPEKIDKILKDLVQLEKNSIMPSYNTLTATYEIDGKLILVLWAIAGEMRPYKTKVHHVKGESSWAYYIRKHSSTVIAKGQDEQELLSLTNKIPFDDRYNVTANLDDLEPHLIREFLTQIKSELAQDSKHMSIEELGERMNIIGGTKEAPFPKNVGLLFFNSHPEKFFPATQIDIVYFPDGAGGDIIEEKIFQGALGRITQDALEFIKNRYIKQKVIKQSNKAQAERFWNYPFQAIEEALVNAVYHRSYEEREPIEVRIEKDEIMILSYPWADRSIKMDDLQQGKAVTRRYRNRRIGEFLKELDLTEGRSTGIPKILRVMKANGSPMPIFETDDEHSYFLIRLPIHQGFLIQDTDFIDNNQIGESTTPQATPQATPQVKKLVEVLQGELDGLSKQALMNKLGLKDGKYFRKAYLLPALEQGVIEMMIPDKPSTPKQRYRLA